MSEKFNNDPVAEHLYGQSLDGGCDAESGSVQDGMWYGMMWVTPSDRVDCEAIPETAEGYILSEDSYGFVRAEMYTDRESLNRAWGEIEEIEWIEEEEEDEMVDSE